MSIFFLEYGSISTLLLTNLWFKLRTLLFANVCVSLNDVGSTFVVCVLVIGFKDWLQMPALQSGWLLLSAELICKLLLQGDWYATVGACCSCSCCCYACAYEFLITKELPILLTITRVQNRIAKKLQIFFFLVFLTILVRF